MKDAQYYIDGTVVTCTVFNENDVHFMATAQATDTGDLPAAMASALEQAKKTRDDYTTETKED